MNKVKSRLEAQQRADEIRGFRRELQSLLDEGVLVLGDDQRRALDQFHEALLGGYGRQFDVDPDAQAKQLTLGMRIASFLGALAIAASVFFGFYQFWGLFAATAQVSVLVASSLLTFVASMWLHQRDASGYFTKLAALVAFCCFVLNIVMLGQIFNITPSDSALLAWAALAGLLAYACDLRLLLVAGLLCATAFVSARVGTWSGMYWLDLGRHPEQFFPVAIAIFFVPAWINQDRFAGFASTYRITALVTLLLPVLLLSNWGEASYLRLDDDVIEGLYQLIGFLVSAGAIWLGIRRQWQGFANTGITFFVIFLYTKMFDWWWEIMPKYLFFLLLGLTALLILFVLRRVRLAQLANAAGLRR